jgi:hypothetical protein
MLEGTLPMSGRRVPVVLIRAFAVIALIAASVTPVGAASSKPNVTVTPTVTGASVSVRVDVNRGTNQIASCTYVLDANAAVSCGTKVANGSKASRYTISLSNQTTGGHTIAVTIRLTDGGSGSASANFTIAPPKVFVIAYSNLDGVAGFDPTGDALISRLVDTNRTNVIDAGDTIEIGTFPADLTGVSRISVGVATHTVATVRFAYSYAVGVYTVAGDDFLWNGNAYYENLLGQGPDDVSYAAESVSTCFLEVKLISPSRPSTALPYVDAPAPCPGLVTVEITP